MFFFEALFARRLRDPNAPDLDGDKQVLDTILNILAKEEKASGLPPSPEFLNPTSLSGNGAMKSPKHIQLQNRSLCTNWRDKSYNANDERTATKSAEKSKNWRENPCKDLVFPPSYPSNFSEYFEPQNNSFECGKVKDFGNQMFAASPMRKHQPLVGDGASFNGNHTNDLASIGFPLGRHKDQILSTNFPNRNKSNESNRMKKCIPNMAEPGTEHVSPRPVRLLAKRNQTDLVQ